MRLAMTRKTYGVLQGRCLCDSWRLTSAAVLSYMPRSDSDPEPPPGEHCLVGIGWPSPQVAIKTQAHPSASDKLRNGRVSTESLPGHDATLGAEPASAPSALRVTCFSVLSARCARGLLCLWARRVEPFSFRPVYQAAAVLVCRDSPPRLALSRRQLPWPNAMTSYYGVLLDSDQGKHGWPVGLRDQNAIASVSVITFNSTPITWWQYTPGFVPDTEVHMGRPLYENAQVHRIAWCSYSGPALETPDNQTLFDSAEFAAALRRLASTLQGLALRHSDEWETYQQHKGSKGYRATSTPGAFRRKLAALLRRLEAGHTGVAFTERDYSIWRQQVAQAKSSGRNYSWHDFVRAVADVPVLPLKDETLQRLRRDKVAFLTGMRRLLHQNAVFETLHSPLTAHLVAKVGNPTRLGLRVWGDFTTLTDGDAESRHCPLWVAKLSSPTAATPLAAKLTSLAPTLFRHLPGCGLLAGRPSRDLS